MIVDCHTHIWQSTQQVALRGGASPARPGRALRPPEAAVWSQQAGIEQHMTACKPVDVAFVLGLRSRHLGLDLANDLVADYAGRNPQRVIGFAGVDPLEGTKACDEVHRAKEQLGLRGIVIAPAIGAMHPTHSSAMAVYELAERLAMPVVIHNSPPLPASAHLEFARPYLLDEVARSFPGLRMVVAQMGYPWVDETLVLLARHEHVYAEISGVTQTPWLALHCMQSAYERGVMEKLLLGSDFPASDAKSAIESLYSLNLIVHGTNLPSVPREQLRGIVERNSPALLGIDLAAGASAEPDAFAEAPEAPKAAGGPDAVVSREPEQSV
jgi:predicted TIM-barrel fold metal-dependent hydrolase